MTESSAASRPQKELMMNDINESVEKLFKEKYVRDCESDACVQVLFVKKPDDGT